MKTFKQVKKLIYLVQIFILFIFMSCNEQGKIMIKLSNTGNYPVLEIKNTGGRNINISPVSSDTGSIGFKADNRLFWLSGKPARITKRKGSVRYLWNVNDSIQAELQAVTNSEIVDLELQLITNEKKTRPDEWLINVKASDKEFFTGALERVVDGNQNRSWAEGIETALNLRDQIVEMKVKSTVAAYSPFYLSSDNYGLYIKGTWPGVFDFCKTIKNNVGISFEGPKMSMSIYLGSPLQIVKQHAYDTGPSFVAPRWAFGPWRWRDEHRNNKTYFDGSAVKAPFNSDITEDILMMQAYEIPCTAYWIDRPWGPGAFGYDDFEIDPVRLPEFEKMVTWLNNKNIELMLWICPWAYGKMADTAKAMGYGLVEKRMRRPSGFSFIPGNVRPTDMKGRSNEEPGTPPGRNTGRTPGTGRRGQNPFLAGGPMQAENMVVMDFTNPEAAKWWGEMGPAKLAKMGVKGFKLDRGDGEREGDSMNLKTYSGVSYRENFNDYCRQYVQATYDAVKPVLGNDFILFPRAQYTGSARYGGMWAGDTYSSDEGLRSVVIALQRCAVMGYPLWTSDAGGYSGMVDREVTMRWIGFACFSPMMEIGPTNNLGFWNLNSKPSYDNELLAVWRLYTRLRMSLVDYIYDLAKKSSETGIPIARPLFLEYPEQPESWNDWRTYKFGDDLLVSVIWEKGVTSQKVYLPSGETWIDLWDNKEYEGGQYVEVDAQTYQIPLFLSKGSTLALPDLTELYNESVKVTSVNYKMSDLEAKEGWK